MKCFYCDGDVCWGGDNTLDEVGIYGEGLASNLHCLKCKAEYQTVRRFDDGE